MSRLSKLDEALFVAAEKGHHRKGMQLINSGANINALKNGETPISKAANFCKWQFVDMAIDANADPNAIDSNGWTPIMSACLSNELEIVEKLIKKGARLDCADRLNRTLLHLASNRLRLTDDRISLVSLLLEIKQLDVNAADQRGETALFYAVKENDFLLAKLLIENGAKIDINNKQDETVRDKAKLEQLREYLTVGYEQEIMNSHILDSKEDLSNGVVF